MDQTPDQRRVTVHEAAEVLGISPEAVRMRIKRRTLHAIFEDDYVAIGDVLRWGLGLRQHPARVH